MCIGVTVLTLPPTVACLGYISWYQGANLCFERLQRQRQQGYYDINDHNRDGDQHEQQRGQRQSLRLKRRRNNVPPDQTFSSYVAGIGTLIGTYYVLSQTFPYLENTNAREELEHNNQKQTPTSNQAKFSSSSFPSSTTKQFQRITHQSQLGYRPPENIMEIVYKVSPPLALRIGTTTIAFFCAGIIQMYVAAYQDSY